LLVVEETKCFAYLFSHSAIRKEKANRYTKLFLFVRKCAKEKGVFL